MTGESSVALASRLRLGVDELGLTLTDAQHDQLLQHVALVARWNAVYNLTAVRDPLAMVSQHVLDSLAAVPALASALRNAPDAHVLDVGSGAGFPGVPFAIALPRCQVTCVDKVGKKASFIQDVRGRLGLSNLRGVHARVETLHPKPWQVVTSRAFASLAEFVSLTDRLMTSDGCWLAMKAQLSAEELGAVQPVAEVFHVEQLRVPGLDADRCLVWMRRHPVP